MTDQAWPAFDALLPVLGFVPSRTGSVVITVYGDAILARGGSLALADLLVLMRRLGTSDGVVRTAISRLARDGMLRGQRTGRHSAYALTDKARAEFEAAIPVIYGPLDRDWAGHLELVFPTDPAERTVLEEVGFSTVTPGAMAGLDPAPPGTASVQAKGTADALRALASRAWPGSEVGAGYALFVDQFAPLLSVSVPTPLDAMAGRTMLAHAYRRLALKTKRLPTALRPEAWHGEEARKLFIQLYRGWSRAAESWLDGTSAGPGPLPRGPDPTLRFSGGDTRPSARAS